MLVVNADAVRDYRLCRYLYNARYNEKLPERLGSERDKLAEKLDEAMRKLVKRAYFHTMSGEGFPSIDRLLYEWDRIWHAGRTIEDIVKARNTPDKNVDSYNSEAVKMIRAFHARTSRNPGKMLGVLGEDYFTPIGPDVVIAGTIDLAIEKDGAIVLPHFTTKNASSFKPGTIGSTKIVLDSIAYRHKTGNIESYASIEYLKNGKSEPVVVTDVMVEEMTGLIMEISTQDRWPASAGTYWCDRCSFGKMCRSW